MQLAIRPQSSRQLSERLGISQPSVSRAIAALGDEVVRVGSAQSIQYALYDTARNLPDISIYRINTEGQIRKLGALLPVRAEGFVMRQEDGVTIHSDSLPWWLFDMRPQGYLGRAYAARYGAEIGVPARLSEWTDTHVLRGLLHNGHDMVGNLLLGEKSRERFLATVVPNPILEINKSNEYASLSLEATRGQVPGSSAGGEQPKFTTYATTADEPRHVIVKFSEFEESNVSERWRDLLLIEHLALDTLREAGVSAAKTQIIDYGTQRFLEVERFDRIGSLGRRVLISLAAFDAQFVGSGSSIWPIITRRLADDGHICPEAAEASNLLWAFGTIIGNTDMHSGNLSFISDHGRPYDIAPAYDMTAMAFAPRSGGGLPDVIPEANIHESVANETWVRAGELGRTFLTRVINENRFSRRFQPCIAALQLHIEAASVKIQRLG
jgi:hypothetical protein